MTSLSYTETQLTREVQLLLTELCLVAETTVAEGAGLLALNLNENDADFEQTRHPDDLHDLERFEIWRRAKRVEAYVQSREWSPTLNNDVALLEVTIERIFTPTVVAEYLSERDLENADPSIDLPAAWSEDAGNIPLGCFYQGVLRQLSLRARARLKMDTGEPLTLSDVAVLTGLKEATVMTAASRKNFKTIEEDNRRFGVPSEILEWMTRNGYEPTILPDSSNERTTSVAAEGKSGIDDFVFVPVARDGTWFSPDCRSGGGYTIGAKGYEQKISDYFVALEALLRMPTPRWRRKNNEGNRGIVAGVRIERTKKSLVEQQLNALTR